MNKFDEVYNKIISQMKHDFKYDIDQEVYVLIDNDPKKGVIRDRRFNGSGQDYFISINDGKATAYPIWQLGRSIQQAVENSKNQEGKEVEIEDGECAVGGAAGMTTDAVFGPQGTYPSVVPHSQKTVNDPGVSTKDISELYTPHTGTPIIGPKGPFRRYKKNKKS